MEKGGSEVGSENEGSRKEGGRRGQRIGEDFKRMKRSERRERRARSNRRRQDWTRKPKSMEKWKKD